MERRGLTKSLVAESARGKKPTFRMDVKRPREPQVEFSDSQAVPYPLIIPAKLMR